MSAFAAAFLLSPRPAGAQGTITAEEAIETQHRQLQEATGTAPCRPPGESDEDIVVCGRRGPDPNRVPFPDQRMPGDRVRLLPGEPPSGMAALDGTAQSPCSTVGANQRCSGGLNVIQVVGVLAKVGKHLLGRDD